MPDYTLYGKDGSCSLVVDALPRELHIPFTYVLLDEPLGGGLKAADGSLTHAEYCQISPSGLAPALKTDNVNITELPAVLHYISSLAPEKQLFGTNNEEQALVEQWLVWGQGYIHEGGFAAAWRPKRFVDDREDVHPLLHVNGMQKTFAGFERIEQNIRGLWMMGKQLTVVDVQFYSFWRWAHRRCNVDMAVKYPKYTGLAKKVERLEGVKAAMKAEKQPLNFED